MSKSLLNPLVQISTICQKSKFQIKFEKVLLLELGRAPVFGPAPWAMAFGRLALPLPTGPRPLGRPSLPSRPRWPRVGGALPACRLLHGEMLHLAPPLPLSMPGSHAGPTRSSSSLGRPLLPPPPSAASAPVTARAPPLITPHHHPSRSPSEMTAFITIMAHHRCLLFLSDARPPRSPSDTINGRPGIHYSHRSSSAPPSPLSAPQVSPRRALLDRHLHRHRTAAFRSPVNPEPRPPCFPLPPLPLVRQPRPP
jgi:hypothetical protein